MGLTSESRLVVIEREVDLFIARETAKLLAAQAGFNSYFCANIETAVSELCSNVLRYGVKGRGILRVTDAYFEVELLDEGPGFGSAATESGGLGIGLAGAKRLMDELSTENLPDGARVVARKYLMDRPVRPPSMWETVCVMSVLRGEVEGGDASLVQESDGRLLAVVVDGLGHGSAAANAAASVVEHVLRHSELEIVRLLTGAHEAAGSTRGAVAMVVRIDPKAGLLDYAGVGDVTGIVMPVQHRLIPQGGCLGVKIPDVRSAQVPWDSGSLLALWTDGARIEQVGDLQSRTLAESAEDLLRRHRSNRDDALLLTVRQREPDIKASRGA